MAEVTAQWISTSYDLCNIKAWKLPGAHPLCVGLPLFRSIRRHEFDPTVTTQRKGLALTL